MYHKRYEFNDFGPCLGHAKSDSMTVAVGSWYEEFCRGTAMLRLRTDGGKSRPPMGGVRRRAAREGRRDAASRGARGTGARRRDAEGVRARGRHALLFRSRRRAAGNPRLRILTPHATYADFSPSTIFECASVTAGTWYARGRSCFFLFRSSLWQLSVARDRAHFPPIPVAQGKLKSKARLKVFGAKCAFRRYTPKECYTVVDVKMTARFLVCED